MSSSQPHNPPTFYVPSSDDENHHPRTQTSMAPRAGRPTTAPAPTLTRAHTSRLMHDADVGSSLDAGFGFYSPATEHRRTLSSAGSPSQHTRADLASPIRRAVTDSVSGAAGPSAPSLEETRARNSGENDDRRKLPRWSLFTSARRTQPSAPALSAALDQSNDGEEKQHHHPKIVDAIRKDLLEDRKEESAEARELAEVRLGGTGKHAFQVAREKEEAGAKKSKDSAGTDLEAQSTGVAETESDETVLESSTGGRAGAGSGGADGGKETPLSEKTPDADLIGWESPDDKANPRNWASKKKWLVTVIVSSYTLLSPLSSSMIAPALPILDQQFGVTNSVQSALMLSTFVLAYAIGPLLLGGLSEMYGRLPILQSANLFLIIFTMASALSHSSAQMTVFRFFAGLGGSAPLTIGGGVISDLYSPDQRGKAMAVYSLAPLLGPCIGPIVAGWIIQAGVSWRWIFWSVLIASGFVAGFGFLTLPETYAPVILAKKRDRLRKETGNEQLHTIFDAQQHESFATRLRRNFIRPFIFIMTQPAVQALSLYMSCIYGVMYILLSDVDATYQRTYNQGPGIASLHYIALGGGFTFGGQVGGRMVDRIYRNMKRKNDGVARPEFKLPFMIFAAPFVPAGLLLYGWTIEYAVHWIVPDIGLFMFGLGMMACFLSTQNFLVDTYQLYAASAVGAAVFLRSVAGFALPLASPTLYGRLGNGWGNSILALIAAVIGIPAPIALYIYGPFLRKKSKYASTSF
ncbi:hypothetical protein V8E36_001863 [Tilletia maclaganii]